MQSLLAMNLNACNVVHRGGEARVLISTDVWARGLDVQQVGLHPANMHLHQVYLQQCNQWCCNVCMQANVV